MSSHQSVHRTKVLGEAIKPLHLGRIALFNLVRLDNNCFVGGGFDIGVQMILNSIDQGLLALFFRDLLALSSMSEDNVGPMPSLLRTKASMKQEGRTMHQRSCPIAVIMLVTKVFWRA